MAQPPGPPLAPATPGSAAIGNCFFRTSDDCISPKANVWTGRRTTQNLRITHSVFWKDTSA